MIKSFAAVVSILIVMIAVMGLHYTRFSYETTTRSLQHMTGLTNMVLLSLSLSYDESHYNRTYPEMQGLSRMDFIYEQ